MSSDITDADLDYLRNINTRPGPNAGRSIDPTKPGPDADRIAELERAIKRTECWTDIPARNAKLNQLRAELSRLRNEQPKDNRTTMSKKIWDAVAVKAAPEYEPSPASPEPQDVRGLIGELQELGRLYAADDVSNTYPGAGELMLQAAAALAQSDAQPNLRGALNHIARLTAQRDALIRVLQRCQMVLLNMAMENERALFNRWPIHHELLRSDAKKLLPLIDSTLDAVPEPEAQSEAAEWHRLMAATLRENARRVHEEWSQTAYRDDEANEALADARRDATKADWHDDCSTSIRALAKPSEKGGAG